MSAHYQAYAEAVNDQLPTYRTQAAEEAAALGKARRAALEQAGRRQAKAIRHWRAFFVPVVNGLIRLGQLAIAFAIVLVVVVAIPKGFIAWNHANTNPHPGTVVAVCSVDTGGGSIDTSAGTFYFYPTTLNGKPYLTSTSIAGLFHQGQLVELTWHGASGIDSYVSAVKFLGQAPPGSCNGSS
jgi:hypothetical protein